MCAEECEIFGVDKPSQFNILKIQTNHVTKLPPDAVTLWESEKSSFEIYRIKDRILSMEAHPEFSEEFLEKHVVKRLYDTLVIDKEYQSEIIKSLTAPDEEFTRSDLVKMCKLFLKNSST